MKATCNDTRRSARLLLVCAVGLLMHVRVVLGQNPLPAGAAAGEIERRLEGQQQQINDLRKLVEAQQRLIEKLSAAMAPVAPPVIAPVVSSSLPDSGPIKAPLSFELGGAAITPIGFLDFIQAWRSRVVSSGVPTNFAAIPFENTVFGARRQTISSAANSRLGAQLDTKVLGANVMGVVETDFLGFQPGNVTTTANAYGLRLRLAFADVRKDKWEILAGQAWSLLTPGRKGISPLTGSLFLTQDLDPNVQSGLVWARTPQLRAVYRPSGTVTVGVSFESGDAYAGGSAGTGAITLPSTFAPDYSGQLNTGGGGVAVPNPNSDGIAKIAFDPKVGERAVHLELATLFARFTFYNPAVSTSFSAVGRGVAFNAGFEVLKNLSLFTNNFYSKGGGRFIFGLGPSLIITGDGAPSLVHASSTVNGLEFQIHPKWKLHSYYSGTFVGRNTTIDYLTGKPAGYGYTGAPGSHNRSIQEITGGFTRLFWKDPNYGTFQFSGQYSWVVRHPWHVAPGQPGSANLKMIYLGLRYLLPGNSPAR